MSVALKAGGNYVVYTGQAQTAEAAFASIMSYLDPAALIYYWNNVTALYEQVIYTTIMVPYGVYWIEVTQDCTWTYGADATAPSSVYLYSRDAVNIVPYLGPAQPVSDTFASIVDYLVGFYYFNNSTKLWEFTPTMVPNGVYAVWVSQNCRWYFVPPFKGTISKMELEYDETWGDIPVSNVPQGQRGIVHIWGRNDTPVAQQMGIYWFVADPDGYVVQEYSTWEAWPYTGAGKEHGFYSGRFNLDKVGKYTIWVELLMNRDDPQVVDQYIGDLCIVAAAVPEPEFAGFGITEYTK